MARASHVCPERSLDQVWHYHWFMGILISEPLKENIMNTNGPPSGKPTIVLIHGLWLTPRSWEGWINRYQKAGYNVIAPSWPGLEGEVEAVRKDPSPLKGLKLKTVVNHHERVLRKLDAPPIIMGHSFGGLITQMLI